MIIEKNVKQWWLPAGWRFVIPGNMVELAEIGAGQWKDLMVCAVPLRQGIDWEFVLISRAMKDRNF